MKKRIGFTLIVIATVFWLEYYTLGGLGIAFLFIDICTTCYQLSNEKD
ncbi:hypothetical protein [Halobacteriovorax sp. BALOs_7]|nr:hypothetical protein [Halobacteriovorax sp. BALOs_7]